MELPFFQLDAFTDTVFGGNPAAVCPLDYWIADAVMQEIAEENNLAETAFYVPEGDDYRIRWFTPRLEVDLCGHATLAAAWTVFNEYPLLGRLVFHSRSGPLPVTRRDDIYTLDFPSRPFSETELPRGLEGKVGQPSAIGENSTGDKLVLVYDDPQAVRGFQPPLSEIAQLPHLGVIVTAAGEDCDFVSRFFAPRAGIDEDPVTGSAHCVLVPYWAQRLGKLELLARQVSRRGGELYCRLGDERVHIGGRVALYAKGTLFMP